MAKEHVLTLAFKGDTENLDKSVTTALTHLEKMGVEAQVLETILTSTFVSPEKTIETFNKKIVVSSDNVEALTATAADLQKVFSKDDSITKLSTKLVEQTALTTKAIKEETRAIKEEYARRIKLANDYEKTRIGLANKVLKEQSLIATKGESSKEVAKLRETERLANAEIALSRRIVKEKEKFAKGDQSYILLQKNIKELVAAHEEAEKEIIASKKREVEETLRLGKEAKAAQLREVKLQETFKANQERIKEELFYSNVKKEEAQSRLQAQQDSIREQIAMASLIREEEEAQAARRLAIAETLERDRIAVVEASIRQQQALYRGGEVAVQRIRDAEEVAQAEQRFAQETTRLREQYARNDISQEIYTSRLTEVTDAYIEESNRRDFTRQAEQAREQNAANEYARFWENALAAREEVEQATTPPTPQTSTVENLREEELARERLGNRIRIQQGEMIDNTNRLVHANRSLLRHIADVVIGYRLVNSVINQIQASLLAIPQAGIEQQATNAALIGVFGTVNATAELQLATDVADKYGQSLTALEVGLRKFAPSAKLAGASLQEVNQIFDDFSAVGTVLHKTDADMQSVFLALEQMFAKGVVQSEEIKKQLGNQLPAAVEIGAQAIGKTPAEFVKAMERNEIIASEFVPKFAKLYRAIFAGEGDEVLLSLADKLFANYQRSITKYAKLNREIYSRIESPLNESIKVLNRAIDAVTKNLDGLTVVAKSIGVILGLRVVVALTSATAAAVRTTAANYALIASYGGLEAASASAIRSIGVYATRITGLTPAVAAGLAGLTALTAALFSASSATVQYGEFVGITTRKQKELSDAYKASREELEKPIDVTIGKSIEDDLALAKKQFSIFNVKKPKVEVDTTSILKSSEEISFFKRELESLTTRKSVEEVQKLREASVNLTRQRLIDLEEYQRETNVFTITLNDQQVSMDNFFNVLWERIKTGTSDFLVFVAKGFGDLFTLLRKLPIVILEGMVLLGAKTAQYTAAYSNFAIAYVKSMGDMGEATKAYSDTLVNTQQDIDNYGGVLNDFMDGLAQKATDYAIGDIVKETAARDFQDFIDFSKNKAKELQEAYKTSEINTPDFASLRALRLADNKNAIDLLKQRYDTHQVSIKEFYNTKRAIEKQALNDELEDIQKTQAKYKKSMEGRLSQVDALERKQASLGAKINLVSIPDKESISAFKLYKKTTEQLEAAYVARNKLQKETEKLETRAKTIASKKYNIDISVNLDIEKANREVKRTILNLQSAYNIGRGKGIEEQAKTRETFLKLHLTKLQSEEEALASAKKYVDVLIEQNQAAAILSRKLDNIDQTRKKEVQDVALLDVAVNNRYIGEIERIEATKRLRSNSILALETELVQLQNSLGGLDRSEDTKRKIQEISRELEVMKATADEAATIIRGTLIDSLSNAFGDFITGAKTAKEAMRDFAISVVNDLAKIAAQQLATSIIGGLFNLATPSTGGFTNVDKTSLFGGDPNAGLLTPSSLSLSSLAPATNNAVASIGSLSVSIVEKAGMTAFDQADLIGKVVKKEMQAISTKTLKQSVRPGGLFNPTNVGNALA